MVGFEDETRWSRVALPSPHVRGEDGEPLRIVQRSVPEDDPDPKAISCYELFLPETEPTWLRFVDGRPVSGIKTRFLLWCSGVLAAAGKEVLVLVWDNASRHVSKEEVGRWIGEHNRGSRRVPSRGEEHKLLVAKEEPVAQPDRAQVGSRQAPRLGDGPSAHRPRVGGPGVLGVRLSALRAPVHSRKGRLIVHSVPPFEK